MNKTHKESLIKSYQGLFKSCASLFLVKNLGLTVNNSKYVRGQLGKIGVRFMVIKNSLAKIAMRGTRFEVIENHLKGPMVFAYAEEPVATAKALTKLVKAQMPLQIAGALVENNFLESESVVAMAKMLSREEAHTKIVTLLKAVPNRFVTLLNEPSARLARALKAHVTNNN